MNTTRTKTLLLAITLIVIPLVILLYIRTGSLKKSSSGLHLDRNNAVPVKVEPIEHGPIEWQRTFSGTLEAQAEFVVAPKVAGRVEQLTVNLADPVTRGQLVGKLDSEEYVQAVAQFQADLAVAKANQTEARSALEIANREFARIQTLRQRGVASAAQLDSVEANKLAKQAELEVAGAQVVRAEAVLETAKIRLGYTRIIADWSSGDQQRVVAERYVDEGETVAANAPLLRIVQLDPISGVVYVTERDYARLQVGQQITLETDAFAGEIFSGRIARVAPVFRPATRQARVELDIENPRQRLKPGMFIRANVVLERKDDATIIPVQALSKRQDKTGVFLVAADGNTVEWREVQIGIQNAERVEITGDLSGRVVTLGQQMLKDGTTITIPAERNASVKPDGEAPHR